ncbi:MAG: hypothetical protein Q4F43_05070 [Eubacteriales bacterium]|nr:hypothetical protein [Eubacteriales bacterium]
MNRKWTRKQGQKADAYFTVEAALLVPVTVCIIVMIMYLCFYLYDRCVLSQDSYVLSYRQSIEKGGADRAGSGAAGDQLRGKLFMLSGLETGCSNGGTIRVSGTASMEPPLFGLDVFSHNRRWRLNVEEKAKKTDPPKDYRRVRRILSLAEDFGF